MSSILNTVIKKDNALSVVVGQSKKGLNWPTLVGDLLLRDVLEAEKFRRCIVLNFDRQDKQISGAVDAEFAHKMTIVNALGVPAGIQTLEEVLEEVKTLISAETSQFSVDDDEGFNLVVVMVYSFSSLEMACGRNGTNKFIAQLCDSLIRTKITTSSSCETTTEVQLIGTVIGTVHSNLHSSQQIASLYQARAGKVGVIELWGGGEILLYTVAI